jgi:inner membrane protein
MDQIVATLLDLGAWRWLALAAVLFTIELATGTAYLLWLSAAAVMTAALSALPGQTGIAFELVLFGAFSIGSTLIGQKFFKPAAIESEQPDINNPMQRHLGAHVIAIGNFAGGQGRVSLGDTQWSAQTLDGSSPTDGVGLKVIRVEGTILHVAAST